MRRHQDKVAPGAEASAAAGAVLSGGEKVEDVVAWHDRLTEELRGVQAEVRVARREARGARANGWEERERHAKIRGIQEHNLRLAAKAKGGSSGVSPGKRRSPRQKAYARHSQERDKAQRAIAVTQRSHEHVVRKHKKGHKLAQSGLASLRAEAAKLTAAKADTERRHGELQEEAVQLRRKIETLKVRGAKVRSPRRSEDKGDGEGGEGGEGGGGAGGDGDRGKASNYSTGGDLGEAGIEQGGGGEGGGTSGAGGGLLPEINP